MLSHHSSSLYQSSCSNGSEYLDVESLLHKDVRFVYHLPIAGSGRRSRPVAVEDGEHAKRMVSMPRGWQWEMAANREDTEIVAKSHMYAVRSGQHCI